MIGFVHIEECKKKDIIFNLYPLYLHDLSVFTDDKVNDEGLYDFNEINCYWEKSEMHSLLIKVNGEIAGFILLTAKPYTKSGTDYCIQEFFIMKKFRRKAVGQQAFKLVIDKFKGKYCLLILKDNDTALKFWRSNYKLNGLYFEEGSIERDGLPHYYHVFET